MTTPASPEITLYLRRFRAALVRLPPDERDDLVAEVRSHLGERRAQGNLGVLDGFEAPEAYAAHFLAEHALTGALAEGTSFALGRALLVGVRDGFLGLFVVVPLFVVQLVALVLVVLGAMKPIIPARIGLFVGARGSLEVLGLYGGDLANVRELLGWWAIPGFIVPGVVALWAGNRALRALARWRLGSSRRQLR